MFCHWNERESPVYKQEDYAPMKRYVDNEQALPALFAKDEQSTDAGSDNNTHIDYILFSCPLHWQLLQ